MAVVWLCHLSIEDFMNTSTNFFVHASAIVDQGAEIGAQTKIWHFVHVSSGAKIGLGCVLGQNVFVGGRAVIGNNVRIQNNVSVYDDVILEDDVFCGPSMVFTNVLNPRSFISRKNEYMKTIVRRGASLGANSTIVCGVTIGEYAFVGAGSVVTKDIPDYGLFYGNPARQHGWMGKRGVRLVEKGQGIWQCPETQEIYEMKEKGLRLRT